MTCTPHEKCLMRKVLGGRSAYERIGWFEWLFDCLNLASHLGAKKNWSCFHSFLGWEKLLTFKFLVDLEWKSFDQKNDWCSFRALRKSFDFETGMNGLYASRKAFDGKVLGGRSAYERLGWFGWLVDRLGAKKFGHVFIDFRMREAINFQIFSWDFSGTRYRQKVGSSFVVKARTDHFLWMIKLLPGF